MNWFLLDRMIVPLSPVRITAGFRRCHPRDRLHVIRWICRWVVAALMTSAPVLAQDDAVEPAAKADEAAHRPEFSEEDLEFFEKRIRPVLVEYCYDCHGPDSERAGGLSVASRLDLMEGGDSGSAISPGDAMGSLLVEAVRYGDRVQMPPDSKLPVEVQADFIRWVERKAAWPKESDVASTPVESFDLDGRRESHWAWQPVQAVPVPRVADSSWPRQPMDQFIMARLEAESLRPAADAAPSAWFRRVSFDLTGLPPSIEALQQFQAKLQAIVDSSGVEVSQLPDVAAYQALKAEVVDQLLASPAYGEHFGRHWLDLVRFAETTGHEFDYPILNAFEYRDYVIRAFNEDVSYQRLVAEHIAGDLLPNPRRHPKQGFNESVLGTTFWYLGEANHAPVDSLIDEAGRVDNQIDVLGKSFLGLTVACARCHDHKFDAISAADYYAWSGVLQGMRRDVGVIDSDQQLEEHWASVHQNVAATAELLKEEVGASPQLTWSADEVAFLLGELDRQREIQSVQSSRSATVELEPEIQRTLRGLASSLRKVAGEENGSGVELPNPLRVFVSYAKRPSTQTVEQWWRKYQKDLQNKVAQAEKFTSLATPLADSDALRGDDWTDTGWAFRDRQNLSLGWNDMQAAIPGLGLDSGNWSEPLPGTLRSPTFEITSPKIHLLMRSNGGKIRLVIDSYRMNQFSALLFEHCLVTDKENNWHWRTLEGDIGRYLGHRAFLEIVDEGPGSIAVSEVWMGEGNPSSPPTATQLYLAEAEAEEPEAIFVALSNALTDAGTIDRDPRTNIDGTIRWNQEEKRTYHAWMQQVALGGESADRFPQLADQKQAYASLNSQSLDLRTVYVATAGTAEDHPVYVRGNTKNLGEMVPHGNLTALQFDEDPRLISQDPTGRLALANEIASAENPLTARVYVNRLWHWLMGRGIVATTDNFGVLGALPTHPELLDHLATELVEKNWSTKEMVRMLVLSRTYAMSSQGNEEGFAQDPANQLWHSAELKRRDAESIRDSMLYLAGDLKEQRYGPSVPVYLTEFMQGRGRPQSGPMDGNGRRSIYLQVRRNFMNPLMLVFDSPVPLSTAGVRTNSNVPAQSLALLNDPLIDSTAEHWANRIQQQFPGSGPDVNGQRLRQMYLAALGREPEVQELEVLQAFLADQDDSDASWKAVAHSLMNLKEFLFLQ